VANNVSVTNQVSAKKLTTTDGVFWANGTAYSIQGPVFMSYQTLAGSQNLAASPATINSINLVFNAVERQSPSGLYNTTTGRFQPTVAGYYQIDAASAIATSGSPTGTVGYSITLYKNTDPVAAGPILAPLILINGYIAPASSLSRLVYLNGTTDYVYCQLLYAAPAGWSTYNNLIPSYFQAVWVRS
jgi:hypothetical protein